MNKQFVKQLMFSTNDLSSHCKWFFCHAIRQSFCPIHGHIIPESTVGKIYKNGISFRMATSCHVSDDVPKEWWHKAYTVASIRKKPYDRNRDTNCFYIFTLSWKHHRCAIHDAQFYKAYEYHIYIYIYESIQYQSTCYKTCINIVFLKRIIWLLLNIWHYTTIYQDNEDTSRWIRRGSTW